MATPSTGPAATTDFTDQERFLVQRTEEAIRDGYQLEEWCRKEIGDPLLFPLNLGKPFRVPNQAHGFFGSLQIGGKTCSVMGCRQIVDFGPAPPNAAAMLPDFVFREFLPRAHWTYADGYPGGFTVEQSLYRTIAGEYGRFADDCRSGCIDWRKLGSEYDWVLLTVQIHDFVMDFGPFRKRFKEAACVAPNPKFIHVVENPTSDYALEVSVGYPFIEFAPIPNHFGFGPGKFGVAVKLYSFYVTKAGRIEVRMYFAAAPRCQRVFDFGKLPDPVYGGAALFSRLSLGLWKPDAFHNKLDAQMLTQHCRVHQALMDGVENVWREWVKGGGR